MNRLMSRTSIVVLLALAGCGGGGADRGARGPAAAFAGPATLEVRVADVTDTPIGGAVVTVVTAGGVQLETATSATGWAKFPDLPGGEAKVFVSAAGFESGAGTTMLQSPTQSWGFVLNAKGAWAVGRAVVLGTRTVERASDGSAMTFSLDVAVIGENSQALETLTSADFSVVAIDCGWGGPRDCASDAAGNATGNFHADSDAQGFELQPPAARHPYLVGVLAERSTDVADWDQKVPALKSFFTTLGGNDAANLASVQTQNGVATLKVLGPFTNDGSMYLDAIDQLASPAGSPPAILDSLTESIRQAAAANSGGIPGAEPTVLVLSSSWLTIAEIDTATTGARQLGVHISSVGFPSYGLPEMAVRTGGFVVHIDDTRQLEFVFDALDQLLAGTTPFYRMQFRIKGGAGTFVSGGNAKVLLRISVPTLIPNRGVYTSLDVAIP